MSPIICIDPGPATHGAAILGTNTWPPPVHFHAADATIPTLQDAAWDARCDQMVIERIASYGMPVGEDVFETVRQAAFVECQVGWGLGRVHRVKRHEVKLALCHSARANDATIRQAIIDLYGGKEKAIGNKKAPGPLYGVKGDAWAAIAVGLAWMIKQREEKP